MIARHELDEEMVYWRKCADEAPTQGAALTAMGVYIGMKIVRERRDQLVNDSADMIAGYLASALASGPADKIYSISDMDKWKDDVRRALLFVARESNGRPKFTPMPDPRNTE